MPERMAKKFGQGTQLIPTPLQVDALIREIPKGQYRTVSDLRQELARRNGATTTCPLCFGIFWRLSAEAAEEDAAEGSAEITPYWRVLKDDLKCNPKLPGGADAHRARLLEEGVQI